MSKRRKRLVFLIPLTILAVIVLGAVLLYGNSVPVLQPKGPVASDQRDLIVFTTALGLLIVLPVFFLTFFIAWKYRASNTKSKYMPDWHGNRRLEAIWWGIPLLLITILGVITWKSSHALDPYKPLKSDVPPITVQVVALEWKWLFIYPEYDIATVNYLQFPEDTPVNFQITADAPMNSFWIPNLGGQVYAMAGMQTKLHLMADSTGEYSGSSANISGAGFAGMRFKAQSVTRADFNQWVDSLQASKDKLDLSAYSKLAQKSRDNPPASYALAEPNLFHAVMMKYMMPKNTDSNTNQEHNSGH